MPTDYNEYSSSVIREKMLLHRFLGEIYSSFWTRSDYSIEVLFAEVDNAGYDVVLMKGNQPAYIQLKAINKESKTNLFNINKRLQEKPGGCVVLIEYTSDSLSYHYFKAENLIQYKTAKHAKANSKGIKGEREGIVQVSKRKFDACTLDELIEKLFK
jgi:hypothetical protein